MKEVHTVAQPMVLRPGGDDLSNERAPAVDALATRDEFMDAVSHDLRNLLSAMVGFAGLIVKEVSRDNHDENVVLHARRIQQSGARMNRLIGDLVDVASIEAGRLTVTLEAADPARVVMEAVEAIRALATAGGISLATEIVPPLPLASFDPARIHQVLTNLLGNAVKFTPAGGTIVVHVERVGEQTWFAVKDSGAGIAADKLEAVFVRFLQLPSNDRGLGLGLYISKCIVEGHGGRIWAESTVGEGSTFHFTLPIHVRTMRSEPVAG